MTDTIEPGDLIRHKANDTIHVFQPFQGMALRPEKWSVIAKGSPDAPWIKHDGSSVNPVPGADIEYVWCGPVERSKADWVNWGVIGFYRVTKAAPSQPPVPQPGWVATAELRFFENQGGMAGITFPSGWTHYVDPRTIDNLDWQPPPPPPPPPWEPEVGEIAYWPGTGAVIVHAIKGEWAWVEGNAGPRTALLSKLSPPKGGEA